MKTKTNGSHVDSGSEYPRYALTGKHPLAPTNPFWFNVRSHPTASAPPHVNSKSSRSRHVPLISPVHSQSAPHCCKYRSHVIPSNVSHRPVPSYVAIKCLHCDTSSQWQSAQGGHPFMPLLLSAMVQSSKYVSVPFPWPTPPFVPSVIVTLSTNTRHS